MSRPQIEIFPWDTMQFIADGTDSSVFKNGDRVHKRYFEPNPLRVVEKYMELTNCASELLNDRPFTTRIVSQFNQKPLFQVRYQIEPIEKVKLDTSNRPVATSRYIPGPQFSVSTLFGIEAGETLWKRQVRELEQSEQSKLDEVRRALEGGIVKPNFSALGLYIASQTYNEGIVILGLNVKMRYNITSDELTFIVTDLAANLSAIGRLWKRDYVDPFAFISRLFTGGS